MDRETQGVTSVYGVALSTLHQFVDMHIKFCSEYESINLDEPRAVSAEEADRVKKIDGLKNKLRHELEQLFHPLLYHAELADSEMERSRRAAMQNQRSPSRSRSRARAGKGNDNDNGKGKNHGTDTGMGRGKGKGSEDSDVNVDNDDWLEEDVIACMSQYMGRDVPALVRLSLMRGFGRRQRWT